jgi:transcriptional regulator with XRE-family HTH domain
MRRVGRLETGEVKDPHYSTLHRIADGLGTTVAALVEEELALPKAEAPAPGPLLDMALAAARRDEEKLWQAVNRADASEGLSAVTEYEEDKFRAQVRALGFPDEYFEGFIWPLVQEAVRAGHLEQENARLKEELDRAHVND